jgi:hypothetical protein
MGRDPLGDGGSDPTILLAHKSRPRMIATQPSASAHPTVAMPTRASQAYGHMGARLRKLVVCSFGNFGSMFAGPDKVFDMIASTKRLRSEAATGLTAGTFICFSIASIASFAWPSAILGAR